MKDKLRVRRNRAEDTTSSLWSRIIRSVTVAAALLFLASQPSGATQTAADQQVGTATQSMPATQSSLDTFTTYLDEQVPRLLDRYGVPGVSMALIREGQVVWSGAYGYADQEQGRKLTVDAIFRVESISKSVTAWGIMRLVEQGLVDLDAPLQQYLESWTLPASAYAAEQITIRRLLSQSAGMPLGSIGEEVEYAPQSAMPSLQEYLTAEAQLIREPGARCFYSNVGFNLLELVIEEVTGRDFAAYMADEVLKPPHCVTGLISTGEGRVV